MSPLRDIPPRLSLVYLGQIQLFKANARFCMDKAVSRTHSQA